MNAYIFLTVLLQSLTKQTSKCKICEGGVLGYSFFLILLIFNLGSHFPMSYHILIDLFHIIKSQNYVLELFGE